MGGWVDGERDGWMVEDNNFDSIFEVPAEVTQFTRKMAVLPNRRYLVHFIHLFTLFSQIYN